MSQKQIITGWSKLSQWWENKVDVQFGSECSLVGLRVDGSSGASVFMLQEQNESAKKG
jgi:hypothetical protein